MQRAWGALILIGCGSVEGGKQDASVQRDTSTVDMMQPIDALGARCDNTKPFGAPTAVTELNSMSEDNLAWLTADELEVWFSSSRAGGLGSSDIYRATRTSRTAPFGTPTLAAGVNTTGIDNRPTLTADGLTMYIEHRAIAGGPYKTYVAVRPSTSQAFGTPTLVTQLSFSGTSNDNSSFVLPDHSAIYILSDRASSAQVFRSARIGGVFQTPVLDAQLTTGNEDYPAPTPDDLTMYMPSRRPGGLGDHDIWRATRNSTVDTYGAPVNLGAPINTAIADIPNWVSADQCVMYMHKANGGNASDIFIATRPL